MGKSSDESSQKMNRNVSFMIINDGSPTIDDEEERDVVEIEYYGAYDKAWKQALRSGYPNVSRELYHSLTVKKINVHRRVDKILGMASEGRLLTEDEKLSILEEIMNATLCGADAE